MSLQTKIPLSKRFDNLIDYESNILLLGSCFSENIGKKLGYFKFQNLQNPFGILFNPKAIENLVASSVNGKTFGETDVFFHNERWHCFDAHSKLSNTSQERLVDTLNSNVQLTNQQINKSTHIIITLGTAWVYRNNESDKIVANCHKVPQKHFKKELLSIEEIEKCIKRTVTSIRSVNSKAAIIFTVSPIRHLKDGFVENTQSKSHLISAIHNFLSANKSPSGVEVYFPSYEIMMDELRDYRFYAEDMIHPNAIAINYIWERFKTVWVAEETLPIMEKVDKVQKGIQHRPFNHNSEAHQSFLQKLEAQKKELSSRFQHITF